MEGTPPVQIIPTRAMSPQEVLMSGLDPLSGAVQQYGSRGYETTQMGFKAALEQRMAEMTGHREMAKAMILQEAYAKRALAMQGAYQERAAATQMWRDIQAMQQQIPAKDFPQYDPSKDSVHSFYGKVVQAYQSSGSGKLDEETKKRQSMIDGGVKVMSGIQSSLDDLTSRYKALLVNPNARQVAQNALTFDANVSSQFSSTLPPDTQKQFDKMIAKRLTPQQAAAVLDKQSGGKGASVTGALNNFVENTLVPYFSDPTKLSQSTQFQAQQLKQEIDRRTVALDAFGKAQPLAASVFWTQRAQQTVGLASQPTDQQQSGLPPNPAAKAPQKPLSPTAEAITPLASAQPNQRPADPTMANSGILGMIANRLRERITLNSPYGPSGHPPPPPWAVSYGGGGPFTNAPSQYANPSEIGTALKALMLGTPEGPLQVPPRAPYASSPMIVPGTNQIPVMASDQSAQQLDVNQIAAALGLYDSPQSNLPVMQSPSVDDSYSFGLNVGGNNGY